MFLSSLKSHVSDRWFGSLSGVDLTERTVRVWVVVVVGVCGLMISGCTNHGPAFVSEALGKTTWVGLQDMAPALLGEGDPKKLPAEAVAAAATLRKGVGWLKDPKGPNR